jgi:phospholipid-binding lipoprotein MlaA
MNRIPRPVPAVRHAHPTSGLAPTLRVVLPAVAVAAALAAMPVRAAESGVDAREIAAAATDRVASESVVAAPADAQAAVPADAEADAPADGPDAVPADTPPAESSPGERPPRRNADPFERVNRATFAFNDALDRMLARPAARLYRAAVPEAGRTAVTNVMSNFEYPTTALNSALQGKFKDAGEGVARFVVNATVGIGGLFDPATNFGLPRHDEDFGQTLGAWGVPSGPFLVLPGFGPSTVRDAPTRLVDRYTNARRYIGAGSTEWVLLGIDLVDTRAQLLQADIALRNAFDPYALVRNAFLQRREYLVRDGQMPEQDYDDFYEDDLPEDEPVDAESATPAPDAVVPPQPAEKPPGD